MRKILITLLITLSTAFITTKVTKYNITEDKIETQVAKLTLDEKIGQMLIIDYRKDKVDQKLNNILTTVKPGGFIFFSENITTYKKTTTMINSIKDSATIPMFLGIDEEGGRIDRFKDIKDYSYEKIPPMSEIKDEQTAYKAGTKIAKILKDFNLNMDFAPVIDVYSNPNNKVIGNRSFGSDPYLVAKLGTSLAQGLKDNNIIPVFKHYPGHGNTKTDSHLALPIVNKTKEELLKSDLIPFKEVANNAEAIMVGHLAVPKITNNNIPASLSKTMINILTQDLNFNNLIITDALNMKALDNYTDKEKYELAINAGANILLMPNDPIKAIELIKQSLKEKKISEEQINNSVYKILKTKNKYLKN